MSGNRRERADSEVVLCSIGLLDANRERSNRLHDPNPQSAVPPAMDYKMLSKGFDPLIADYYERAPEESRLEQGPFRLEEARTRELIQRYAPPPPGTVLDVGGAAGAYALWLAQAGYAVHLLDAVPRLVAEAQARSATSEWPLVSCGVGDARALDLPAESVDVVLLLGPLYHLTDPEDRVLALHEAARVLRPGGRLFAAAISRWASALDGLARELLQDPRFARIVEQDLRDGQHRNPTERLDYFTTAYFHRPEELAAEVQAAGLDLNGVYGVEGPGWILPDVAERMADVHRRASLLRVARLVETEQSLVGSSAHLLAIAKRPA
jgi:ubiquinone/menaquinone biosynthesis C-methylase UbiE